MSDEKLNEKRKEFEEGIAYFNQVRKQIEGYLKEVRKEYPELEFDNKKTLKELFIASDEGSKAIRYAFRQLFDPFKQKIYDHETDLKHLKNLEKEITTNHPDAKELHDALEALVNTNQTILSEAKSLYASITGLENKEF